jgi:hypothetical protein
MEFRYPAAKKAPPVTKSTRLGVIGQPQVDIGDKSQVGQGFAAD